MGEETKSVNGKDESTAAAATVLCAEEKADDSEKPITQFSLQDSQSLNSNPPPTSLSISLYLFVTCDSFKYYYYYIRLFYSSI